MIKKVIGNLCESDLNVVGREKNTKRVGVNVNGSQRLWTIELRLNDC